VGAQIVCGKAVFEAAMGVYRPGEIETMRKIHSKNNVAARIAATVAVLPTFIATASFAQNYPAQMSPADPPALVARVGFVLGEVSFLPAGSGEWAEGINNYPMTSGDRLYCGPGSQAEIGAGSTDVRMWQNADVTLTNLTDQYEQIGLANGSIRVRIYGINPGATVEVDTPNGSAVITQPGDYRFDVFSQDGSSDAVVNAGALQITGPEQLDQEVVAGQAVQMSGTNPIELFPVSLPPFDALDQWSIERDHQILYSVSARYVSPQTPGFSDLDANGSWVPSPDYGPVWYPATVPVGWRPYSVGHWAYVAPWGYTWIDAAPWGYAPFHYGRWAVVQGRWGWVPGPPAVAPVYSPALVAFVGGPGISISIGIGGGGGGVAAWFPLGVGEPFVPWYHASPAYARQVNVTNVNITNIHNTTIVNNYNTYITNTRTVNNITQINTNTIQYANRAQVTAVPATAMSSGRPVAQAAVNMTPAVRQQLAAAPVHYAPSAPAPTHSLLQPRANVKAPVTAPILITPRGLAKATPAANPARLAPVNLPKPQPASALPKPVAGAIAGRPATSQPPAARAAVKTAAPAAQPAATPPAPPAPAPAPRPAAASEKPAPAAPSRPAPAQEQQHPAPAAASHPAPAHEQQHPAPAKPAEAKTPQEQHPATESQPRSATPPPSHTVAPPAHPQTAPATKPAPKPKPKPEEKPEEQKPQ